MAILYVLIKCRTGNEKTVRNSLTNIDSIDRVDIVTGEFDLIIRLRAESTGKLQSIVLGKIRNIPHIIQTVSLPVIDLT